MCVLPHTVKKHLVQELLGDRLVLHHAHEEAEHAGLGASEETFQGLGVAGRDGLQTGPLFGLRLHGHHRRSRDLGRRVRWKGSDAAGGVSGERLPDRPPNEQARRGAVLTVTMSVQMRP